jgi:type IV secretory pathway VirB2 component (pilin)
MPGKMKLAIYARLASMAVFPLATLAAALMQRSLLAIVLIALAMTAMHAIAMPARARVALRGQGNLVRMLVQVFLGRFFLAAIVFVAVLGISALFGEISLARAIGWPDFWLAAGTLGVSTGLMVFARRLMGEQAGDIEAKLRRASPGQGHASGAAGEGDVIDGEFERIDPKDDAPD